MVAFAPRRVRRTSARLTPPPPGRIIPLTDCRPVYSLCLPNFTFTFASLSQALYLPTRGLSLIPPARQESVMRKFYLLVVGITLAVVTIPPLNTTVHSVPQHP